VYILVQTLIGDDGFVDAETLAALPDNVVRIYSKNVHHAHDKLIPMPIGRDWRTTAEGLTETYRRCDFEGYQNLVYMNFSIETNKSVREPIYERLHEEPWVTARLPEAYGKYELTHHKFVEEIHRHNFCLSPLGRAVDCYRTWDAMFAKSIPIVDLTLHTSHYEDLPMVLIDDWGLISKYFLEEVFHTMLRCEYNFEKLTARYWRARVRADMQSFL